MEKGFIKVPRSIIDQPWYNDSVAVRIYLHLLAKAVWSNISITYNEEVVNLRPGQYWTTLSRLALEIGYTKRTVQRAVEALKRYKAVTVTCTRKGTILELFRDEPEQARYEEGTLPFENGTPNGTQNVPKYKNNINKNNINKNNTHTSDELTVWQHYLQKTHRTQEYLLTPKRKTWIKNALKSYPVSDCLAAVDRFVDDDWPDRQRFLDIKYLFGEQSRIDKWCRGIEISAFSKAKSSVNKIQETTQLAMEIAKGAGA